MKTHFLPLETLRITKAKMSKYTIILDRIPHNLEKEPNKPGKGGGWKEFMQIYNSLCAILKSKQLNTKLF